jgi:hypothetical protein
LRISVSGGLGVSYFRAVDIVNRVNWFGPTERVSEFVAAAEFFVALGIPLNADWTIKMEYSYLVTGYNVTTAFPGSDFSVHVHMPTIIAQHVLVNRGVYNVKAGFGVGYHIGTYEELYGTADTKFTGQGIGSKLDLEANTALGDDFFAYLGGDIRWDFIGELESDTGQTDAGPTPGLDFFDIGAKLGFTWYF